MDFSAATASAATAATASTSMAMAIPRRHRALLSQQKAVYKGEFPLTAEFRSGPRGYKKSYEDWVDQQLMPHGQAVDLQTNILRFEPENWKYANRFAAEHPETMVLSTWRAASGMPKGTPDDGDPLGVSTISFPGHWVLSPGTTLAGAGINPASDVIRVASTDNMRRGPALLVETTPSGEKLWDRFEYVLIQRVDQEASTVEVRRQFNGSPAARVFPSGTTQLLPMPWDDRNRKPYTDFFFNLSEHCPRDANDQTAMDVLLQDMVGPLREGGPLDLIAGVDLASGPLTVNPDLADYDLDGTVDDDSVYRRGVETFYKRIRNVIGQDGVLTTSLDKEFAKYINGVNQEGLANPDDPWEHSTRTVNNVLSWEKFAQLPVVGLALQQHMDREETLLRVQLQRLLSGYSVCLGMAADIETGSGSQALDEIKRIELYKGDEAEPHWLGKAVGMSRPATMTPNLLNGSNDDDKANDWATIVPSLGVKRGTIVADGDEMVLRPDEGDSAGYLTLDLNFDLGEKSDFVVYMEAISDDDQLLRKILLPKINVDVEHEAARAEITSKDYLPLGFYFRGASAGSVTVGLRFEHGGDVRFRNLSVHKAADSLACEFENGVVLVNPSKEDVSFNLNAIFPGRSGFHRLSASVPQGAADIPDRYLPQLRQAMELNNGARIGNNRSLSVPHRNAIFLVANGIAITDDSEQPQQPQPEASSSSSPAAAVEEELPIQAIEEIPPIEVVVQDADLPTQLTPLPTDAPVSSSSASEEPEEANVDLSEDEQAWEELYQINQEALELEEIKSELANPEDEDEQQANFASEFTQQETASQSDLSSSSNNTLLLVGIGIMAALAFVAIGFAGLLIRKRRSARDVTKESDGGSVKKLDMRHSSTLGNTAHYSRSCNSLADDFHDNYLGSRSNSESSLDSAGLTIEDGLLIPTVQSIGYNGGQEAIEIGLGGSL